MQNRLVFDALEIAGRIAEHLAGWRAEGRRAFDGRPEPECASLMRASDGAQLDLFVGSRRRRRWVTIRARWPRFRDGSTAVHWPILEFTCSARRSPGAMARAIDRRLLVTYNEVYPRAVAEVRNSDVATAEAWVVAQRLARAIGAKPPAPDDPVWRPNDSPVFVHGGPVGVHDLEVIPRRGDEGIRIQFQVRLDEDAASRVLNVIGALHRSNERARFPGSDSDNQHDRGEFQHRDSRGEGNGHVRNQMFLHR